MKKQNEVTAETGTQMHVNENANSAVRDPEICVVCTDRQRWASNRRLFQERRETKVILTNYQLSTMPGKNIGKRAYKSTYY